ncbi:MAG: UPF0175 family protein [Planctomycetota bacterium]
MCDVTITVPREQLSALNVPPERAAAEVRMLAAVKLYELGRLSSGAAAEFAGIPSPCSWNVWAITAWRRSAKLRTNSRKNREMPEVVVDTVAAPVSASP